MILYLFATVWMELAIGMLGETSQAEKDKCYIVLPRVDSRRADFLEAESGKLAPRGWGG
jgi:hypothetical protein